MEYNVLEYLVLILYGTVTYQKWVGNLDKNVFMSYSSLVGYF